MITTKSAARTTASPSGNTLEAISALPEYKAIPSRVRQLLDAGL